MLKLERRTKEVDELEERLAEIKRVSPKLPAILEEVAEKRIPDSRKRQLDATRRRIQEASEAKDVAYLARREQSSAYVPTYNDLDR